MHDVAEIRLKGWLGLTLVLALAQPSLAAAAVRPMLARLATPEATVADAGAPQYAVLSCQRGPTVSALGACYDPFQMRRAYGLDGLIAAGYDGSGRTIVIVDAFQHPTLSSQLALFDDFYGLPPISLTQFAPDGLTPFNPADDNMQGWAGEISLDVEWAHAIAPGANIVLVLARSNQDADILSALKYAVDNDLGDVISMSFGENESCLDPATLSAYHDVFIAATLKGITLFASTGDEGAAQFTCDGSSWVQAASHPATDPLVTAVGGTELHAASWPAACTSSTACPDPTPVPGTYQGEVAWNEGPAPYGDFSNVFDATIATGGGFSVVFDEPPYQKATLPGGKQRAVPDVAYNAAVLHGVLAILIPPLVSAPSIFRFGGTSAGAPQWAAMTVIANQKAGKRLGFLNSAVYQIGRVAKAYPASFHDVTQGTNTALEFDASNAPVLVTGFAAGGGWDATTGLGSPVGSGIVDNLIRFVSPGDGGAAVSTTKPKPHPKPVVPGHVEPH